MTGKKRIFFVGTCYFSLAFICFVFSSIFPNPTNASEKTVIEAIKCTRATAKGRRESNEDFAVCDELYDDLLGTFVALGAVFDGHDGGTVAKKAQESISEVLQKNLNKRESRENSHEFASTQKRYEDAIRISLRDVHEGLYDDDNPERLSGGSTALVTVVSEESVSIGWLGDSRAYLCDDRNEAKAVTSDHSVKNRKDEVERVRKEGGVVTKFRAEGLLITRALGDWSSKGVGGAEAETTSISLTKIDEFWDGDDDDDDDVAPARKHNISSSSSSSSSSRKVRGVLLLSDGFVEVSESNSEFMNELCEIMFGNNISNAIVRRRVKRRRFDLEATIIPIVGADIEFPQDEKILPVEAWANIQSYSEDNNMNRKARLACEMAIAMGSSDNVAITAINLQTVNDDYVEENEDEEEQGDDDNDIIFLDPKPGAVLADTFRLNDIVALSLGPVKNGLGDQIRAAAQHSLDEGEENPSYSDSIEISSWNVDVYRGSAFSIDDIDAAYFSSALAALPEFLDESAENQQSQIKFNDADIVFAMLMLAPTNTETDMIGGGKDDKRQVAKIEMTTNWWWQPLWKRAKNAISSTRQHLPHLLRNDDSERKRIFAKGHFGEVWRATAFDVGSLTPQCRTKRGVQANETTSSSSSSSSSFVMKRIFVERGDDVRLSGRREIYFGNKFCDETNNVARFHRAFETVTVKAERELWLAFRDEGISLDRLIYEDKGGGFEQPSEWWIEQRKITAHAQHYPTDSLREILREIARGVAKVHDLNVAHRDIKPANVFVSFGNDGTADVRIGDFGSAVDEESFHSLYGPRGPNHDQETPDFAPPESLFRANQPENNDSEQNQRKITTSLFDISKYKSYDAWSLGILYLEVLALGTSRVWDDGFVNDAGNRERLHRDESLRDMSPETRLAYTRIRAMLSLCIAPSYANFGDGSRRSSSSSGVYSGACLEENLMQRIKLRDPLNLGLPNEWALRLIRRLLRWNPDKRLLVSRVEKHAFFKEKIDNITGDKFFANEGWTCSEDASGFVFEFIDECEEECNATCA